MLASSRPATPNGGGSSGTSTTARNSAWSRSSSRCASPSRGLPTIRKRRRSYRRGGRELSLRLEELRELARGIHPAILTHLGSCRRWRRLPTRSTLPVEVRAYRLSGSRGDRSGGVLRRLGTLANVAKYASASRARVELAATTACSWSRSPTTASAVRMPAAERAPRAVRPGRSAGRPPPRLERAWTGHDRACRAPDLRRLQTPEPTGRGGYGRTCGGGSRRRPDGADVGGRAGVGGVDVASSSDAPVRISTARAPGVFIPAPSRCSISAASPIGSSRRAR